MSITSIVITVVSNITVLVSHNMIFFRYFAYQPCCQEEDSSKCPPPPPTSLSPTRFSPGLFVVLQEMLNQTSIAVIRLFAKDNAFSKKISFFL